MKILVLTTSFSEGYGGKLVYNLMKSLPLRIKVEILMPGGAGLQADDQVDGMPVHRFWYLFPKGLQRVAHGKGMAENLKSSWFARLQLPFFLTAFFFSALAKGRKVDILHAQWLTPGLVAVLTKPLLRKPVVITVIGSDTRQMPSWLVRFILNRADAVISTSPELSQLLLGYGITGFHEIWNMIDFDGFHKPGQKLRYKSLTSGKPIVSFIARLSEWKDPLTFVKAIPDVLSRHPSAQFFVVGDGELACEVQRLVRELGVSSHVTLTGKIEDVRPILTATQVFTALSPVENVFSVVIIEAMFLGVPCVITRAGMTERYFKHRVHALLVRPKDPRELADALCELLSSKELREKLSVGGRQFLKLQGFSKRDIVGKTVKVYSSVTRRRA